METSLFPDLYFDITRSGGFQECENGFYFMDQESESVVLYQNGQFSTVIDGNNERIGWFQVQGDSIIYKTYDEAVPFYDQAPVSYTKQLQELGVINYLITVGIPSYFDLGEKWGDGEYYNKPWEVMANIYGGVEEYENSQIDINAAYKYHRGSQKIGPMILIFIE